MSDRIPPELLRGTILELKDLTVSFDGFIGPNGAGKTTMMDVVTGKTRPDSGSAVFGEINLLELSEPEIAEAGIGRKFQKPTVFERLTVFENLEISLWGDKRFMKALFARLTRGQNDHIRDVLEVIVTFPDGREVSSSDPAIHDRLSELIGELARLESLPALSEKRR